METQPKLTLPSPRFWAFLRKRLATLDGRWKCKMAAEVLIKKGKRGAAAYFQSECARTSNPRQLNELLDIILDPRKPIDIWDTIDWCKWLMAGGKTPDEFSQTVRRYDNATTCGLVWTANFVAYRCRTCGISPCMSLCADCFQQGNHQGHDFNMFRSQAGGACDCGDASVMREDGFCHRHGPKAQVGKPPAPPDLLCVAESMMPRVILRLVQHLREHSSSVDAGTVGQKAVQEADGFLTMLHQLSEMGAVMRQVMTHALTNPLSYRTLTCAAAIDVEDEEKAKFLRHNYECYEEAKRRLQNWECPPEYQEIASLQPVLMHNSFLEELVFWMVKFEFPQKLVCFLLNMLPDINYKEAFTQTFVQHYSRISHMLTQSTDSETLSNRVVHVSVQLFSNEALSLRMTRRAHLLHIMVISLRAMMSLILQPSTLQEGERNFHYVVNCGHRIAKDHCYWPLVSDLNNILTHRPVAMEFLADTRLLDMWFSLLSMFQGMNVNQRELTQHVEFEPNTYYAAFSAELEASATPLWALISHLKNEETLPLSKNVLERCLTALEDFFDSIGFKKDDTPNPYQVSFHLPLHRYYAVFLCQAVTRQGATLVELLPDTDILMTLMAHPLQAMVSFHEILCGLWARNGLQIKGQAMTYIQCHFCNSMVDADLFLLQLCATHLDPDWFISTVFQRFHVWEWLSLSPNRANSFLEPDKVLPMLEAALTFLAMLFSVRTNLGMSEAEVTRQEMVSLLCMGDRTHSQLMDLLPEKCGTSAHSRDFEAFLEEVALYKQPNFEAGGNLLQGMYVPQGSVWEREYDPVHVQLRAVHRKDYQASMDRYMHFMRQSGRLKGSATPWPPYRLPRTVHPELVDPRKLLQCKTMQAALFIILFKALKDPEVPEQILALTVYLLEMALQFHPHSVSQKDDLTSVAEVTDLSLLDWFPETCIVQNALRTIKTVMLPDGLALTPSGVDDMEVDQDPDEFLEEAEDALAFLFPSASGSFPELTAGTEAHDAGSTTAPQLPPSGQPLALPPSSPTPETGALVPVNPEAGTMVPAFYSSPPPSFYAQPLAGPSHPSTPALPAPNDTGTAESATNTALVPTTGGGRARASADQAAAHSGALVPSTTTLVPTTSGAAGGVPSDALVRHGAAGGSTGAAVSGPVGALVPLGRGLAQLSRRLRSHGLRSRAGGGGVNNGNGSSGCHPQLPACKPRHELESSTAFKALPPSDAPRPVAEIDESLVSLLLKLHSKLSGRPDSYRLPDKDQGGPTPEEQERDRVGAGPHFLGLLLDKLVRLTRTGDRESPVEEVRRRIWPPQFSDGEGSSATPSTSAAAREASDREERRRRAKERQMKLMAEFANRQKSFLKKAMEIETEELDMAEQLSEPETMVSVAKEYECVICSQTSPSTVARPVGMVVLLQATSVMGHAREEEEADRKLPCSDEERLPLLRDASRSAYMKQRFETLTMHFDDFPLAQSVNIGWEGGVHVQTCGHYLHLDCHKSYMLSQRSQQSQRLQTVAVERGEYWCPLCRQLANSVLPLHPEEPRGTLVRRGMTPNAQLVQDLSAMLAHKPPVEEPTIKEMRPFMEDLTNATFSQYRTISYLPNSHSLVLFLCSIARTNLEAEIVLRKRNLCLPQPQQVKKQSCFLPLFRVLALHADRWMERRQAPFWSQLTGMVLSENLTSLTPVERKVPVFVCDPAAVLLELMLALPLDLERAYYTCLVRSLYALNYVQSLVQISCNLGHVARTQFKQKSLGSPNSLESADSVLGLLVEQLEQGNLYIDDEDMDTHVRQRDQELTGHQLEKQVMAMCGPFLRIAALLQSHLFEEKLPIAADPADELGMLCLFLGLGREGQPPQLAAAGVSWVTESPQVLLRSWCREFNQFAGGVPVAARGLMSVRWNWAQPRLLSLPGRYDELFQYYHSRACSNCHSVPKDPSVCLVCGTLVCLRESCCRQQAHFEAVHHSINCGAGTAIYLAVNSSTVIVIRGKRACLWGSVYLDSFGEEDRDLKRGKPLYLSVERYQLLQQQWTTHAFDHTSRRWVWHKDNL
ncbi:E3 ubiquitin-protein ligase ubr3 isoform X2 [Dermacentor albipictus]|uniref:E3 ubiquitin-protein ligase ubr3 isoform X2 n=1 Tax=Dermacentor albipictus TaxID=60249 RepID=UPI0038FD0910